MSDSTGNTAEPVFRRMRLVSPCTARERWCADTQACSFNGVCSTAAAGMAALASVFGDAVLPGHAAASTEADYDDYYAYLYDAEEEEEGASAVVEDSAGDGLGAYDVGGYTHDYSDSDIAAISGAASVEVVMEEEKDTVAPVVRAEKRLVRRPVFAVFVSEVTTGPRLLPGRGPH